jgi:hypothetical protein
LIERHGLATGTRTASSDLTGTPSNFIGGNRALAIGYAAMIESMIKLGEIERQMFFRHLMKRAGNLCRFVHFDFPNAFLICVLAMRTDNTVRPANFLKCIIL